MTTASKRGGLRWGLPIRGLHISGAGAAPNEERRGLADDDSEAESDMDTTSLGETSADAARRSRDFLAPEADEITIPVTHTINPDSVDLRKKRFSVGWGRFMPKLGKPGAAQALPTSESTAPSDSTPPMTYAAVSTIPEQMHESKTRGLVSNAEPRADVKPGKPALSPSSVTTPANIYPPQRQELETKIVRQIIRELNSGGFFYSFDFDLTHSLQHKRRILSSRSKSCTTLSDLLSQDGDASHTFPPSPLQTPTPSFRSELIHGASRREKASEGEDDFIEPDIRVPLWRRVDRRFFWNEWLLKDFLDLGLHGYILPIMQGWVQSSTFTIPIPPNPLDPSISLGVVPIDLVVISRRSRERAGLRYQRRGIDDEGHVANMVETEMIVRAKVRCY